MKILIAEDDENSRILLESVLFSSGYEVLSAVNGKKALTLAEKETPDLIISDILMPEMDGYMLCQKLKADKRLSAIPLVFYTATYTEPKDRQYAMDIGCSLFLVKPMEMDLLLKEVKSLLDVSGKKREPAAPEKNALDLEQKYTDVLARKLDKKVRELEQEHEKLKLSEQKYKRIVESLRKEYFFYTRDPKAGLTYISPSVELILGHKQEDCLNYTAYLTDHPVNKKALENSEQVTQGKKQPVWEVEIRHQDGSVRRIEVSEEPILDKRGRVVSIEGIAQDVTQKKVAEARIRQVHKMEALGTLARGIAHDFNNILSGILGYVDLIGDDFEPGSKSHIRVKMISRAGRRARSLISQIMTYSRETGQVKERVRIQDILDEALTLLRPGIPATIEFDLNIPPDCRPVLADPTQIHQVIMNLCTNAHYSMKDKTGKLSISLSEVDMLPPEKIPGADPKSGACIRLEIKDTGCGIQTADLDNIFDPYFTTKDKEEGTGLGLAMVHGIVNGLGGHILVESQPGRGTCFSIYLPLNS